MDSVLAQSDIQSLLQRFPRPLVVEGIRRVLNARRQELLKSENDSLASMQAVSAQAVMGAISRWMEPSLKKVINATGIVLHTNLGRAPLSQQAVDQLALVGGCYCNLELDLNTGRRGSRMDLIGDILLELTGAQASLVVNNNAAAMYLALRALARGKEVLISRGQLVEIGGSFRVPDVMQASGARMIEVGTTNKTRLADYERALNPQTAMILVVHRSNFEVVGFTEDATLQQLSALARSKDLPLVLDLGSCTLLNQPPAAWGEVPDLRQMLQPETPGPDLVCFSGDKLLGGPQAGILLGRGPLIERLREDPMARALRVDRLTLAALAATLSIYRGGDVGARQIPILRMLMEDTQDLKARAQDLLQAIHKAGAVVDAEVVVCEGQVGGGSMPMLKLPGFAVAVAPKTGGPQALAERLRLGTPAILARVHQERVLLDVRTLIDRQELETLALAVRQAGDETEAGQGAPEARC